jgi:diguanylate cyclase (GGDEF)-like protein/PAS domain S-box-containing protein
MKRGPHAPSEHAPGEEPEPPASQGLAPARADESLRPTVVAPLLLRDARLALRESEAQFRELIEQASDGIFVADAVGNYLLANPRLCEMLGYSETQLLASNVAISYPEIDAADLDRRLQRIQRERQMLFTRVVKRRDGSCFRADISLRLLKNGLSQGIVRDVSVRDHEVRLLGLEHFVARIFAAADDASAAIIAVIRAVCEAENWEYGRYWQADEAAGRITRGDYWCLPNPDVAQYLASSGGSLERGEGLPGMVWETGEAVWVPDLRHEPRIARPNLAAETGLRSCCVFPIISEGKTLGVFAFMSRQVRESDGRMLATVAVIGSQVGQFLRRKNAEAALSASEQFARSTLDSLPDHLCVIDGQGIVLTVNRAWRDFAAVGGASSLRVGEGVNYLEACDRQQGVEAPHARRLALGVRRVLSGRQATFSMEYACQTRAGERWFLARASRFAGSGAVRVIVAHKEITARVHSTAAQRVSEARFSAAFEHAPIGVALEALDGRFLKVNQALCQLVGYSEQELTGRQFKDITHPDDLGRDLQSIEEMVSGKTRDYHTEKRYIHKNGREMWVQLGVSLIRDANDQPEHFIAHVQDISENKRIEETSKRSEAMFRDMFSSSPVPLAVTGPHLRFVHLNPAFTESFGYTLEDIPTLHDWWERAYPDPAYRQLAVSNWQESANKRDRSAVPVAPRERRIRCMNGEDRIVMVGAANLGDSSEGTTLVIFYDITERKQAEHAIREYASQQHLIAEFGQKALANTDLDELMQHLAGLAASGLNVDFCEVLQIGPDGRSLLYKAGIGWQAGWVGGVEPDSEELTHTGFVLSRREPLTVTDFASDTRFARSETLSTHHICSGIVVPILGSAGPLGIIGAYSRGPRHFSLENVNFLQSLANTMGTAIDRKALEQRFAYLAQFDSLTGLPNRSLLLDRFTQTLTLAARHRWMVGILFVDLDRFKVVNDTRGHGMGDALLVQVAGRLQECVRTADTVGRLGGDEFAVVLSALERAADAGLVADKVINALSLPFHLEGQEIYISASLGIAMYPSDGTRADELLKNSDTAMYRAKERGRNTFQYYVPEMNERSAERLALETQLRGALERQEFLLHYQPKANIATGEISGFEALLRWQHPVRGLVGPDLFISILEDTGMIVPVGEWVLRTVCEQLTRWKAAGILTRPVAVNLSARQFQQKNLDSVIAAILAETRVDADLLELELTESMLMKDPEEARQTLEALRAYGVALAVDDFGTGYSSLLYLQRFPLDALKIDRAFIRDITTKPDDASIAVAIITLAHSLKLKVIAEGVETEAQLNFLRANGCDEMQGYYFSPALNVESCTRALIERRRLPPLGRHVPAHGNHGVDTIPG